MLRKELRVHMVAFLVLLVAFTTYFLATNNNEFLIYVGVLVIFAALIIISDKYLTWPSWLVWLLFSWAVLHVLGGGLRIGDIVLYSQMLIPIVGEPYNILKYDQVVHAFGFFVATLVCWHVLKPHLSKKFGRVGIAFILIAAGMGLGAVNEIVEFMAVVLIPNTNVGGYENTAIDLVANAIGAFLAVVVLWNTKWKR